VGDTLPIVMVAAVADNGVIGRSGRMPWHLPSELRHFRALTMGHPLVMGRKTFDAIGRPLDGRLNIVLTRDPVLAAPRMVAAPCLERALELAAGQRAGAIMIIGGADVFAQAMPLASRLEITRVRLNPDGDTVFPPIDPAAWVVAAHRHYPRQWDEEAEYDIVTYIRSQSAGAAR
jgi:dihydrofolate reductase